MAIDINAVHIEGRLGSDPETRMTPGGSKFVTVRIAVQDDYKPSNSSEWKKRTYWITVSAAGKTGDELEQFQKGDRILIFGKWTVEEFEKDGRKVYFNKLFAQHIRATERRFPQQDDPSTQRYSSRDQQQQSRPATQTRQPPAGNAEFDDDIPF